MKTEGRNREDEDLKFEALFADGCRVHQQAVDGPEDNLPKDLIFAEFGPDSGILKENTSKRGWCGAFTI